MRKYQQVVYVVEERIGRFWLPSSEWPLLASKACAAAFVTRIKTKRVRLARYARVSAGVER